MELSQPLKISNDSGKSLAAPICELVNKYVDIFTKPGKYIVQDIQYKTFSFLIL